MNAVRARDRVITMIGKEAMEKDTAEMKRDPGRWRDELLTLRHSNRSDRTKYFGELRRRYTEVVLLAR